MTAAGPTDATASPRYRDPAAAVDARVEDLLARMTMTEKLAQLGSAWIFQLAGPDGLDPDRAGPLLEHGIGHVTRLSGASSLRATESAELANELQRHLRDHTRLGIPAIMHEEICSGLMAREATVFAQAIGVASTFRPDHNRALGDAIRGQMRAMGAHHGLSPVLDVCRDPRWGRLEETYGEDPHLVSRMGAEFVRGLQGDDLSRGVVATAKHFVGYGASEGGMNWAPAHLPPRELADVYLRPFEHAIRDAGLASVMNGYHELDGVPCGADRALLTALLRDEWGFDGTVVSDYFAVRQLRDYHHVVSDEPAAAAAALHAGIDVELPSTDCFGAPLAAAIDQSTITVADVDTAVRRVLTAKVRLGLFEDPFVEVGSVREHTRTAAHGDLAASIARDSMVLLRNDGTLPLAGSATVALIGPNAASVRNLLGDYSYPAHIESLLEVLKSGDNVFSMPLDEGLEVDQDADLAGVPTVLDALVERVGSAAVVHAPGCDVTGDDRSGFDDAVAAATAADVAVIVMGEKSGLTEDCTTGESRDVASFDLPGVQEELVAAVAATGTPIVLVLVAGRPIGSPAIHEAAAAVLMAWLPGEAGAMAIVDVLTGATSPGGKLPVSYPRSSGQVPIFYAHKVSGGRSHWKGPYVDESNEPLHPFGHGLGYADLSLSVAPVDDEVPVGVDAVVDIAVTLANRSQRAGDEVVQLYSRDPVASITRPVRELQAFQRVSLEAGEQVVVTFHLPIAALGFTGRDLAHVVEPGVIELFVGRSSADLVPAGGVVIRGDDPIATRRIVAGPATVTRRS